MGRSLVGELHATMKDRQVGGVVAPGSGSGRTVMRLTGHGADAARGLRLFPAVALLGFGLSIAGCERPPLHVRRTGTTFVIDVQTLGEYQTSVQRIRLTRGREVVWEVVAREGTPGLDPVRWTG